MPVGSDLRTQSSTLAIKVKGADLSSNEMGQVVDITIDQDLILPDAFAIRIRDIADQPGRREQKQLPLLDADRFKIGSDVEIALGREARAEPVLKAEITSLELEMRADGTPIITVRGYDRAFRLHRERKTRSFVNQKDSNIATTIAQEHGLTPTVDATSVVHPHVIQENQTDWEFLRARARRVGYELFVADRRLVFRKPASTASAPDQEFGQTLRHLRLRMSAPSQVKEVEVQGWDVAAKRAIVGLAQRPGNSAGTDEGKSGASVAAPLGNGRFVLGNQPVHSAEEATELAQSILDDIAGSFVQLDGVCLGDARIKPGHPLKLKNLSRRFDQEYYVSAASHRVTPTEGYMTHFTVSGRRPTSLIALLHDGGPGAPRAASAGHPGVVVGVVTNNKDTEMGGRAKVSFPWLGGQESHWARLAAPMAGKQRGFYWLPEVGDEVLVAFEHGDINRPYIVGGLWNGEDRPPQPADSVVGSTGHVDRRIITSRSGHTITIDDSDNQPGITIVDKTGNNTIKLDSASNKLTIQVAGDMEMKARGRVTITGLDVTIEATGGLKAKGATVDAEATTSMKVKGATTNLEAAGPLAVKGAMVNIN